MLKFGGLNDLAAFMRRDLVLRYKWSNEAAAERRRPQGAAVAGRMRDNRRVGPVEWERISVNENVSALEPSIITED